MGLHVYIYKCGQFSDCTNGGVSSSPYVEGFTLTNVEGPHEPDSRYPAAELKKGHYGSVHIKPAWNEDEHTLAHMFGMFVGYLRIRSRDVHARRDFFLLSSKFLVHQVHACVEPCFFIDCS